MSNNVIVRHFTVSQTVIQVPFLIFSYRERAWFLLFIFSYSMFSSPLSFSMPSRQMTEERMHRAGRRKKREGCRNGERLHGGSNTITNKRVSHRLGGGRSVNDKLNQHHHQQNQKVCHHRRAGKCNRFPCPSLHRELPAPPLHSSVDGGGGGG